MVSYVISIHLMFLFISKTQKMHMNFSLHFNTSNVFVYLLKTPSLTLIQQNFNTSNVFVYQCESIHNDRTIQHFNTSNVFVYRMYRRKNLKIFHDFNTSNVFVYPNIFAILINLFQFQYI